MGWNWNHSYSQLPSAFFAEVLPTPVTAPQLIWWNDALAESLGLQEFSENAAAIFSGNHIPEGAKPIAQAYAGHQFGNFTMLGDGRAILLGEHLTPHNKRVDIQLKGAGKTPFSRRGDGRAALAPMLREVIISEAMHALGIPTTRSLAVVSTGEIVFRETALQGAILTRIASSHVRVGSFEYAALTKDVALLKSLADYTIQRHYPAIINTANPYLSLLQEVIKTQALLVIEWMRVGFIHGVMNTDNMSIAGETIDYGPCAFMNHYDAGTVFSSIDHQGRYALGNQPHIAQWNLARFAETLLPLLNAEIPAAIEMAEEAIHSFSDFYETHWLAMMRKKLGLFGEEPEDKTLISTLLQWMQENQADYTYSFRQLRAGEPLPANPIQDSIFQHWYENWQARLKRNSKPIASSLCLMRASNPAIIPRNHLAEAALSAAEAGDFTPLNQMLKILSKPYQENADSSAYQNPPPPETRAYQTYCGT